MQIDPKTRRLNADSRRRQQDPQHCPDSRLEAAYHRADTAIQRVVDLLAAA